jgi:4-hydroxybenzoate polyprenyltransferase
VPEITYTNDALSIETARPGSVFWTIVRAMRPTQWTKNGVIFAGLVFGGKLFEAGALATAVAAVVVFCLLSSGFYLVNDVRDLEADRYHPIKRLRPVAAGRITPAAATWMGIAFITLANIGALFLGSGFVLIAAAYTVLMVAYNLGLKHFVIVDVLAIAAGFVLRAAAGASAVNVSISPWLLICTMLLALVIGFGKRRHELTTLDSAALHRPNLSIYSRALLDRAVAVTAAGTLIAYVAYTIDAESAPADHRMMLTVPLVAYGLYRYLFLLYRRDEGGSPESLLLTDRGMLASVAAWGVLSAILFYFPH